jgi:hypothetical protein
MRRTLTQAIAAAAIAFSVACARRPNREIDQARRQLAEAERAQAPLYARGSYDEARKCLTQAEHLADEHRYEDARVVALESVTHSRSAVGMSAENKKKMLDALRLSLQTTDRDLADAEQEIALAESRHVDAPTIDLFRRDLVGARGKVREAQRLHDAGDLPGGRKASEDAKIAADMLLHEIRFAAAERPITHPPEKKKKRRPAAPK